MKRTLLIALLFVAACGDDDKSNEVVVETPEAEACEHLAEGPFKGITAAAAVTDMLENSAVKHTSVNVSLTDYEGARGGFVEFQAEAAGDFLLFLSADVPLEVFDSAGNQVPIESTTIGSDLCTEIATTHTVEFSVGTYVLAFGPTSETAVGLVHELSDHADDQVQ